MMMIEHTCFIIIIILVERTMLTSLYMEDV